MKRKRPFSLGLDALGINARLAFRSAVRLNRIVLSYLTNNSDMLGFWVLPSSFIVYVHPTLAHTFDLDYPAIYFHVIGIDRR